MPAFNAEKTLKNVFSDLPHDIIDTILLVDDKSTDKTTLIARKLGMKTFQHHKNMGYGANQKTCYQEALKYGADIVVMLHPDYQYDPRLVLPIASMIASGAYDIVLGSRILAIHPVKLGMPIYKYVANRFLTLFQNFMLQKNLSEYHTGFRAFSREVLETIPFLLNSDDFIFDNQIIIQAVKLKFRIGEISCPAKYFSDASSINLKRSLIYGFGVIINTILYWLEKLEIKQTSWIGSTSNSAKKNDYYAEIE